MGMCMGNFATNPIYRLPRREPLFGRRPFCGDCNAELTARDLFPIFSWFSTGGKCRYCGGQIPAAYVVAEILVTLLFAFAYLRYGFGDDFMLIALGGTAMVMLVMMEIIDNWFSLLTLTALIVLGMLYRTMHEGTLTGFAGTMFYMFLLGAVWWKAVSRSKTRFPDVPAYVWLLTVAGVWLPPAACMVFVAALALVLLARKALTPQQLPLSAYYFTLLAVGLLCPQTVQWLLALR